MEQPIVQKSQHSYERQEWISSWEESWREGGDQGPFISTSLCTVHAFASDNAVVVLLMLVLHPSLKEITITRV